MYHINIKNFHNNDRPNKTALRILSQLKITKVYIVEKFRKENNKISSKNASIPKKKKNIFVCAFCSPQSSSYHRLKFESFGQKQMMSSQNGEN